MTMTHPGLPLPWAVAVFVLAGAISLWAIFAGMPAARRGWFLDLRGVPGLGHVVRALTAGPWVQLAFKIGITALFLLVVVAGLFGTPIPERNAATVLTWTLWWTVLVMAVFFLGSAWCAVCPWDALASWLVRHRLWRRGAPHTSLNLRVPRQLRNVWPALGMFVGLTWLELGVGVTTNPYATAMLALLMVVLATASLAIFERKAFCRYFCPVGRTIGFYAQLAPVELRPSKPDVCAQCKTLDCYYGTKDVEPCPTHLVMGRLKQNTYCTSCGACTLSCPHDNVAWRMRTMAAEAKHHARPHWDEAWFILGLVALTSFHGLTMMPFWEQWMTEFGRRIDDSGQLLWTFSLGMVAVMAAPVVLFAAVVGLTRRVASLDVPFQRLFSQFAFAVLPLAFAYHLAHNLNHLVRESSGAGEIWANPLGIGARPLSMQELHARHMDLLIPQVLLFALQAGLMVFGFWIAVQVLRHRGRELMAAGSGLSRLRLVPMLVFLAAVGGFNMWLLMEPMVMRF